MVEINAAYEILSDSTARKEYDRLRGSKPKSGDSYFGEDINDPPKGIDPLQKDWTVAVRYFPDLEKLESRLANLSWRVANAYRAYILETKAFETRAEVAETMEREFLNTYFGTNPAIVSYARSLIKLGHRAAAKELNEVVRVVGSNIDAAQVIDRIRTDFRVRTMVTSVEAEQLAARIASRATVGGRKNVRLIELEYYVKLINMIGGEVTWPSSGFFSEPRCRVLLSGVEHTFNNALDFSQWVLNEVIPNI